MCANNNIYDCTYLCMHSLMHTHTQRYDGKWVSATSVLTILTSTYHIEKHNHSHYNWVFSPPFLNLLDQAGQLVR